MENKEEPISIAAVGDVFLGDHYVTVGHGIATISRNGMLSECLQAAKPALEGADIVIGNLECPISDHTEAQGAFQRACFLGVPGSGYALRNAGFNIMSVANNHILQHGSRAFQETLDELHSAHIKPVGLVAADGSPQPLILDIRGKSVGIIAFSLIPERYTPKYGGYARGTGQELMDAVARLRPEVDKLVVGLHFGDEGVPVPSPQSKALCMKLVDCGADVILGHHPHVFQPVTSVKNSIIAYSLGNFLFNQFWHRPLVESAIVHIRLHESAADFSLTPVRLGIDSQVKVMKNSKALRFKKKFARRAWMIEHPNLHRWLYPPYLLILRMLIQMKKYPWFAIHFSKGERILKQQFTLRKIGVKRT